MFLFTSLMGEGKDVFLTDRWRFQTRSSLCSGAAEGSACSQQSPDTPVPHYLNRSFLGKPTVTFVQNFRYVGFCYPQRLVLSYPILRRPSSS